MTTTNWSRWYREGTVNVVKGSKNVTGTSTYWTSASLKAGDIFSLDGVTDYEVSSVTDDTHLVLATAYKGNSANEQEYHIVRTFNATTGAQVASQTADLVSDMARFVDTKHATIMGKSAYEIAKANGYTGTESAWLASLVGKSAYEVARDGGYTGTQAQWLESLKAAGEWVTLNARTSYLDEMEGCGHNSIYRGKNLGTAPTDAQWAAIKAGTFDDMYIGDYWLNDRVYYRIAAFDYYTSISINAGQALNRDTGELGTITLYRPAPPVGHPYFHHHIVIFMDNYKYSGPMYDEDDRNEDGSFVGYASCHYSRVIRPQIKAEAAGVFGAEHMFTWHSDIPARFTSEGIGVGSVRLELDVDPPSQEFCAGYPFMARSGTMQGQSTTQTTPKMGMNFFTGDRGQAPLFMNWHAHRRRYGDFHSSFWLRELSGVVGTSLVSGGMMNCPTRGYLATDVDNFSPIFLIGQV